MDDLWDHGNFDLAKEISAPVAVVKPTSGHTQMESELLHADFDSLGDPDDWAGLL